MLKIDIRGRSTTQVTAHPKSSEMVTKHFYSK